MALNQHSPEWQRVIAEAALAGVVFTSGFRPGPSGRPYHKLRVWYAMHPKAATVTAMSKLSAALQMLEALKA